MKKILMLISVFVIATKLSAVGTPTGLTATTASNYVNLTWSAVTSAANYNVFENGSLVSMVNISTTTMTKLIVGNSYSFGVQSVDRFGNLSGVSAYVTITAGGSIPIPPQIYYVAPAPGVTFATSGSVSSTGGAVNQGAAGSSSWPMTDATTQAILNALTLTASNELNVAKQLSLSAAVMAAALTGTVQIATPNSGPYYASLTASTAWTYISLTCTAQPCNVIISNQSPVDALLWDLNGVTSVPTISGVSLSAGTNSTLQLDVTPNINILHWHFPTSSSADHADSINKSK